MLRRTLVTSLLAALLIGCGATPSPEVATLTTLPPTDTTMPATATRTATPTDVPATATPTSTPAPAKTPSQTATAVATPAPTWTSVRDATRQTCEYDRWSPEKLPDMEALRWERLGEDVRHLAGFEYRAVALNAALDGTAVAIMLQSGGLESSLAVIDVQANAHWWWARETYHTVNSGFDRWLPDGRLLYVANGQVRIGTRDNWHVIETPAPVADVHYAANDVAFATEAETNEWWRLDLSAETWERVPNAIPGHDIHVAQDGSYVAGFDWIDRVWRAPVAMGSGDAEVVSLDTEDVDYLGSGRTPLPPVHLANSHYWRLDTWEARTPRMELGGRYAVTREGMIVNDRTGERITLDDLPVPARYNHDARYEVPADGEWLAVDLWEISAVEPRQIVTYGLYVSPSDTLTGGSTLHYVELVGWVTEPEAVVVRTRPTNTLAVASLPLTSETDPVPLDDAGELLTTVPGGIVTIDATQPARLLLFDLDGAVVDTLDLSDRSDVVERAFAAGNRVYLTAADEDPNNCAYGLVEWTVSPGR